MKRFLIIVTQRMLKAFSSWVMQGKYMTIFTLEIFHKDNDTALQTNKKRINHLYEDRISYQIQT